MRLLPLLICLILPAAHAVEPPPPPPVPEGPTPAEVAPPVGQQELPEAEVRIIQRGEEIIEEYAVEGRVYMVKITPSRGAPYYLIDSDGDGSLETHRHNLADPDIQQWILLRW